MFEREMRTLGAAALAILFAACQPVDAPPAPTPAKAPEAPVQTDRDRYAFQNGVWGLELTIDSTLKAPPDRTLYLVNCNGAITPGLQRLVDGKWVDAWMAMTNACLSAPIEMPPGSTRTEKIVVRPGPVVYPPKAQQLEAGTYRVVWHNVLTSFNFKAPTGQPLGDELPMEQRVSAPITIEVPAPPARPAEISYLEPPEDARVPTNNRIRVEFLFSRGNFRLVPATLRLYVDGHDVTSESLKAGTEDVPMSQMEIIFERPGGWSPGRHDARIEIRDKRKNTIAYSWSFVV